MPGFLFENVFACAKQGPLDWETAWQVWPIASAIGTCGGAAIGALLASVGTAALLPSDE